MDARHARRVVHRHPGRSVEARHSGGLALWRTRRRRDRLAVRPAEAHASARASFQAVPALVDEPVVVTAQLDQVREVGAAALCPVLDVVGVQEPVLVATGEAAGSVTAPQRSLERR